LKELSRYRIFGNNTNKLSLHDRVITSIAPKDGGICIALAPCDDTWYSSPVDSVFISHCDWEDAMIDYQQRFAPFHIPLFIGKSIEPEQLTKLLDKGRRLEIIEEYFGNDLLWTLGISPYRFRQHPTICICFPVCAESEIIYYSIK
jgi:hypothetical protein